MDRIKAIDICCGAGGWACAARGLPIDIVYAVDLWEPAVRTYRLNNPATVVEEGDIRETRIQEAIQHEAGKNGVSLVLGAIPCKWLSRYRRIQPASSVELDRERRTLDCALRIVRDLHPTAWALEDVGEIVKELPIMTPYQMIDAKRFCGQRRRRCYVGDFPPPREPKSSPKLLRDYIREGPYRVGQRLVGRRLTTNRNWVDGSALRADLDRKAPAVCNLGSRRDAELGIADDGIAGGRRQMEWQEAASLQGFPGDYVFVGCLGNVWMMVADAVCIPVARAILKAIVGRFARLSRHAEQR